MLYLELQKLIGRLPNEHNQLDILYAYVVNFHLTFIDTGWGRDKKIKDETILKLTQIDVAIRDPLYCNYLMNKTVIEGKVQPSLQIQYFFPDLLISSQFCADQTTLSDDVKTTFGDSGGPSVRR